MAISVGINGFGRMGRLSFRAAWNNSNLNFIQINEISGNAACSAHLLKFDSVHGRWLPDCHSEQGNIVIDDTRIAYSSHTTIAETDWSSCDIVIEATGQFRQVEQLQAYFDQGVQKVIVAAPVTGALNIVYGINDDLYDPAQHHLLTAASCTTNCLAPVIKVLHEKIGIEHGCMTTIHDMTNTQTLIDTGHADLRRARAGGKSLIPTSSGSAKAIVQIFPELEGKLNGMAVRVPLLNASLTDLVIEASRAVTAEEVNQYFKQAATHELNGILGFEERPLVSVDFKDDPRSGIVDALSTMVIDGTQVKVLIWYDNEWGYVNRMMELADKVATSLPVSSSI